MHLVLHDDGEAERHQQRRQNIAAQRAVENAKLQQIAEGRRHGDDHDEARQRMQAGQLDNQQGEIRGRDNQIAMRDVDQPHDPENQRQAGGKQRVEAANQDALNDGVDPMHAVSRQNTRR